MTQQPTLRDAQAARATAGPALVACPSWEALRDELRHSLANPGDDPFVEQVVVCDAPAARRDLSQHLARTLGATGDAGGVCAGVRFVSLRGLRRDLDERLLGQAADTDPWRSRGLALALLDVFTEVAGASWFAPVAHHLGAEGRPGRRLATAERIARLFLGYCRTAPQLVRAWNEGGMQGPDGTQLRPAEQWQPMLWRRVRDHLAASGATDPVQRHERLVAALLEADDRTLLPGTDGRLRVVDPTVCAPLDRELLAALARRLDNRIWLLEGPGRARELGLQRWREVAASWEQAPGEVPRPAAMDVHSSHGPDRQVEVLREVLCGLFQDDPGLEPRDVVVACTDLDGSAPLVRAAFCLDQDVVGERLHPGHLLRVQLADSALDQPNQVLEVLRQVLHLAGSRATAQDLVDLCASRPVATRFGFTDDDLERVARLVEQSGTRWGLDARHRADFGLGQVRQSTWIAGVERILVGVAMGTQPLRWVGTALPVDQVDSSDVMVAGRLAEVVSRVRKLLGEWQQDAPVGDWVARLRLAVDLLTRTGSDDAWMSAAAHAELADLADLTVDRTSALGLGDVAMLFDRLLRPRSGRPNFGNGSLLVCGLADLGSVPHRVVCILGLDDQSFPERPSLDGDDLTSWLPADPEVDRRSRSRQLLEDAVASARDRLVVVHQGHTTRTNQPVPMPVAVIDLVERGRRLGRVSSHRHTLQPQSGLNFAAASGQPPFSFDAQAMLGARAHRARLALPGEPPQPLWSVRLPASDEGSSDVDVAQLLDFYRHPARELLRHRLGVTMTEWDTTLPGDLPIEPGGLEEWAIGDRMVRLALDGLDVGQVTAAERLRGDLPPGQLGARTLNRLLPQVDRIVAAAQRERATPPHDLDCTLDLGDQVLTGRIRVHGASVVGLGFSRTAASHLLEAWFQVLLLAATQPAPPTGWRAVHIGRDAIATLLAPPAEGAARLLAEAVGLRQAGLHQLVPLPPRTATEFLGLVPLRPYGERDLDQSARKAFGFEYDADWARFVPKDFDRLRRIEPVPGDPGVPGPSRFENLADWLFSPLRDQMSVGNLR